MRKISSVKDLKAVAETIIEKLVGGSLAYFNLTVADSTGFSQCFFTPTSEIRGKKQTMCFVGDYEKVMALLMSHPKVSDIQYDLKENAVLAIFENPYQEELDSREEF